MSNLEQIVRPSQTGDIRPIPTSNQKVPATPGDNVITWGSSGSNIFQVSAHLSQSLPPAAWPKSDETARTYDTIRVKNPDDPAQHVDVEAMTEYQARNKIDQSRITLRYAKQGPSDNVEVLNTGNVRKQSAP